MSYNPNQPYEQWQQQQPPIDPHQQQLQIVDPQAVTATSSLPSNPTGGGGGEYLQSQQSYSWTDGNTQGQHHQSQQSWSWQGQGQLPVQQQLTSPIAIQSPAPVFPAILQNDNFAHQDLHQQMHQTATSHFQQVQAYHRQFADMHRSMCDLAMGNMAPMMLQNQQQHPQIAYQQVASPPPPPPPIQVQSIGQQNYFPDQQQLARIEYQPMLPVPSVQQVQYQNQPGPQGECFPRQQAQIAYSPMTPPAPVHQAQYQGVARQEDLPQLPPQRQQQRLLPPDVAVQRPQYQQRLYQQQQTTQHDAVSRSPRAQTASPRVLQSPPEAPTQRKLQSQPSEQPLQTALSISSRPNDHRLMNLERQRKADVESTNRAGAEIHRRLQDLEQSRTRAQQDNDAKDREVRRVQDQLNTVERQRCQDAERNSQQLADLVRSQATTPASTTGSFDMSALEKVVRETQAYQLTAHDIERVIEEQVGKRLAGMATKQDLQNAGAQMQGALSKLPAGLSQQEVQQAVSRELNNVMQDVADRVHQQRRDGGQGQLGSQSVQNRVQTELVVEELPDDAVATRSGRARQHGGTQRQLLPAEMGGRPAVATSSTITQLVVPPAPKIGAPGSNQPPTTSHVPPVLQSSTAPVQAQIAAPCAGPRPINPNVVTNNALVTSKRPIAAINIAPQDSRLRALESSPAAPSLPENVLAREERSVSGTNIPFGEESPPRNLQRVEAPAAQRQIVAPPAATRQQILQQPTRRVLQQIKPAPEEQRQLGAPPTQSEESLGIGQELVLQGREVARKTPGKRQQ